MALVLASIRLALLMPAPFGTCPAPKITTGEPCGRWLEDGQRVCRAHAGTDAKGQCAGETGPKAARVRCAAWPLTGSAFCGAHDPVAKAERRATKDSLPSQLARLRQRVSPSVGVKALELLLLRRKVTVGDVVAVLTEYRVGL